MSASVASLGSINVDFVASVDEGDVDDFAARYDWFPEPGETVGIDDVPAGFDRLSFRTHLGGKGANQAVAASRAGADTAFLGMVGTDHREYGVLDSLRDAGVDTGGVAVAAVRTGRAYVLVDGSGESYVISVEGANDRVDTAFVRERYDAVRAAEVLLLQNELPVAPMDWLLGRLDDEPDGPTVVLDPAPAGGVGPLLAHQSVDVVTPNDVEYRALRADLGDFDGTVIRTRGARGVEVEGGESFGVAPPDVDPVDTTGAGDTFAGYLAARLAAGDALREAVATAVVAATLSVREEGAQSSIPDIDAVCSHSTGSR